MSAIFNFIGVKGTLFFFFVRIHTRSKTEREKKKLKNANTECFVKHQVKLDYNVSHIYSHLCGSQISRHDFLRLKKNTK